MYSIFEELLKEQGITVADVSRGTGIRQSTLSNWKKRDNMLTAKNAILVANFLGVSVDYLMGRTDERKGFMDRQINSVFTVSEDEMQEEVKHLLNPKPDSIPTAQEWRLAGKIHKLTKENRTKTETYVDNLLTLQDAEEELLAAHREIEFDKEATKHDLEILKELKKNDMES